LRRRRRKTRKKKRAEGMKAKLKKASRKRTKGTVRR
jgi:hypothetical protein